MFPKNCFWGRSITGSGACTDPLRYNAFGPFTPGFPIVEYNNIKALEEMLSVDKNICGVFLEPIQGEGGINVPAEGYF